MAQFFNRSANNIARISMVMVVVLAGAAFYVYTQVARSSYLTGRYLEKQQPIGAHEIQYPIMQGWDSVEVQADVELGGTDQLFNILVGRDLQKEEGQPQQVVLVLPILEGLDGVQKMSKSLNNYVAVNDSPNDIFGKLMSISDELMARYYPLLLGRAQPPQLHPMEAKKQLASEMVAAFHTAVDGARALEEWERRFSAKRLDQADLLVGLEPEGDRAVGDALCRHAARRLDPRLGGARRRRRDQQRQQHRPGRRDAHLGTAGAGAGPMVIGLPVIDCAPTPPPPCPASTSGV